MQISKTNSITLNEIELRCNFLFNMDKIEAILKILHRFNIEDYVLFKLKLSITLIIRK